jgi:hypothetical protein
MKMIAVENIKYLGFISRAKPGAAAGDDGSDHHAMAISIYEADRAISEDAHVHWQYHSRDESWSNCMKRPEWGASRNYRYEPKSSHINAARAHMLTEGDTYWAPNLLIGDHLHEGIWMNTPQQKLWLSKGLIFKSRAQAIACATRMLAAVDP